MADLSYAVPEARFGYTEVKIGFVPALVSVFLVRKIGEGRARELMLTGSLIPAETERYGMITAVVPADRIAGHVKEVAERLCAEASSNSLKVTKQLISSVFDQTLADGLEAAARTNAETRRHPDCQKGIAAFLTKRNPSGKGETAVWHRFFTYQTNNHLICVKCHLSTCWCWP